MMNPTLDQWLREHYGLTATYHSAVTSSEAARQSLAEADAAGQGRTRIPFVGGREKTTLRELRQYVGDCEAYEAEVGEHLEELAEGLDQYTLHLMEEAGDDALLHGQGLVQYYAICRRRIQRMRARIKEFLVSIGEVRACISVGYRAAQKSYSGPALAAMENCAELAHEVDTALRAIRTLSKEFQENTRKTVYADLNLPHFGEPAYEVLVVDAGKQPIGVASKVFQSLLEDFEEIQGRGADQALERLCSLESEHDSYTLRMARARWKGWQRELFRQGQRMPRQNPEVASSV